VLDLGKKSNTDESDGTAERTGTYYAGRARRQSPAAAHKMAERLRVVDSEGPAIVAAFLRRCESHARRGSSSI